MSDSEGCSEHIKATVCKHCKKCKRCRNDDCLLEDHPVGRQERSLANQLSKIRAEKRKALREAEAAPKRAAAPTDTLAEERFTKVVDEVIKEEEEALFQESAYPIAAIAEQLSLTLPKQLKERQSTFNLDQLNCISNKESIVKLAHEVHKSVFASVTDSDEAAEKALSIIQQAMLRESSKAYTDALDNLADAFMRDSDPIGQRKAFAVLCESFPKNELKTLLEQARQRALQSLEYMANARPRFYSKRVDVDADEIDDDQVEEGLDVSGDTHDGGGSSTSIKVEVSVDRQLQRKVAWATSTSKRAKAVEDLKLLRSGQSLLPIWSKSRVQKESLLAVLKFLEDKSLGWKGGASRNSVAIGDACSVQDMPYLNMGFTLTVAWNLYKETAIANAGKVYNEKAVGYPTFRLLYNGIAKVATAKHSLSYYFTNGLEALEYTNQILDRVSEMESSLRRSEFEQHFKEMQDLGYTTSSLKEALPFCISHLKYGLRTHVKTASCEDGDVYHCASFAVGKSCSASITHNRGICYECQTFLYMPYYVRELIKALKTGLSRAMPDAKDDLAELTSMIPPLEYCAKSLDLYHRHVHRGVWQNAKVSELIANLKPGECLVILDHKQKLQATNFYESSEDYYGKKGMSLLGFFARWREVENGPICSHYFDVLSLNSKQDGRQVLALLDVFVPRLKDHVNLLKKIILLSDNGPAFTAKENAKHVWLKNKKEWNCEVKVTRWIFFESQCGKTALDTHFSFIGIYITRYARQTRAVKVHADVFDALTDGGGIANTTTLLVGFDDEEEDSTETDKTNKDATVQDIRKLHDIVFEETGVKTYFFTDVQRNSETVTYKSDEMSKPALVTTLKNSFTSPRKVEAADKAQVGSAPAGPSIKSKSHSKPLDLTICEGLTEFATGNRTSHLIHVAPPLVIRENTEENQASKKAKILDGDNIAGTFQFQPGWAVAEQRKPLELSSKLCDVLQGMVSLTYCSRQIR